jgi:paraquat-inducible protein B
VSARTHPRAVGGFVLGAILLTLGAVLFFSSGDWFRHKTHFSVFFPGSVRGLNPGAPVTFRGIKIGQVEEVKAVLTGKPSPLIAIEATVEFDREIVEVPAGVPSPYRSLPAAELAKALIEHGIRGRLQSQSLLTGQKYVDFDFLPDEPARFAHLNPRYPELPTTPTALEKLGDKFEQFVGTLAELPLDEMLQDVRQALQSLRELLEAPELRGTLRKADRAMGELGPALEETRTTLAQARTHMDTLSAEVRSTGGATRETLAEASRTLENAERTLQRLDNVTAGADDARLAATQAIAELERTLKALRNLVDYVQTHPEAVVLGKAREKEK